jgi:hypothetical protein
MDTVQYSKQKCPVFRGVERGAGGELCWPGSTSKQQAGVLSKLKTRQK